MSVYVDPLFDWPKSPKWPYGAVSHLYADTHRELHLFAKKLGLKREWCSDNVHGPDCTLLHYDLNPKMRAKAVRLGAKEKNHRHKLPYQAAGHPLFQDFCRSVASQHAGEAPRYKTWEEWEPLWRIFLGGASAGKKYLESKGHIRPAATDKYLNKKKGRMDR